MRICICDDDRTQCEYLKDMIMNHSSHVVTTYYSAEQLLFECAEHYPFDCIFLDIQMKEMNGIDCARKIREKDANVAIVFLTAIADYVFEGYEVNAVRYLMKPLQKNKCHELLDMIQNSLHIEKSYILINKTKIACEEIIYVESFGHYCGIHTDETIEMKVGINELMKQLPETFIQTHRSYIVNLEHVESVQKDKCLLDTKEMIPISRSSIKKVNEAFMEHIKGGLYL